MYSQSGMLQLDALEPRRLFTAAHPVAINFVDEALFEENFATSLAYAKSLGVTAVRLWAGFDTLEDRPNVWDPVYPYGSFTLGEAGGDPRVNSMGQVMRRAFQLKDAGMSVMLIFNDRQGDAPESAEAVKGFFRHLMDSPESVDGTRTLKDVVDYWEIGNEVDSATYWKASALNKTTGIQRYVNEYLIPAAEELKNGANELVVSAGVSWNPADLETLLAAVAGAGKLDLVDYAGYHPYGTYDPTISSVNQIAERTAAALVVGQTYGKELVATEWNVRGFGNTGANDAKWAVAMEEAYRDTILPNYHIAYYFQLINNWAARGGTVSARPGGLLKHDTTIQVTPSSPVEDIRQYYWAPLVPAEPFYSVYNGWKYGSVSGVVINASPDATGLPQQVQVFVDLNDDGSLTEGEPAAMTDGFGNFKIQYTRDQADGKTHDLLTVLPEGWTEAVPPPTVTLNPSAATKGTVVSVLAPGVTGPALGSISGTLFNDTDGDGTFEPDAGETITGKRTVFLDANRNKILDASETRIESDSLGRYTFSDLPAGTYYVSRVYPSGYRMSNNADGYITVQLFAGQSKTDVMVGTTNLPPAPPPPPPPVITVGSLSGRLWQDANGDGIADVGELGFAGQTVYVDFNENGLFDAGELSATTGVTGAFTISYDTAIVTTGEYSVRPVLPADWQQSTPVRKVAIGAARSDTGVTIGAESTVVTPPDPDPDPVVTTGSASGVVWNDTDGDGIVDVDESKLAGRTVYFDLNNNSQLDTGEPTAVSGATGDFTIDYDIAVVAPGVYSLRQVLPGDWSSTTAAVTANLDAGRADRGFGFGSKLNVVTPPPVIDTRTASIGGYLFNDSNANGSQDASETRTGTRTVFVDTNRNKKLDAGEISMSSDAQGVFKFSGLAAGTYYVSRVFPSGWRMSNNTDGYLTVTVGIGQAYTQANIGTTDKPAGWTPPPTDPNTPVDPRTASISGFLWNDDDADGTVDSSESRTGSRTVFIDTNRNGKLDSGEVSTKSNAAGEYTFSRLAAGTYYISRVFPSGWRMSNNTDGYLVVVVASAQSVSGVNIGTTDKTVIPPPPPPPPVTPGAISGALFYDSDADGIVDPLESYQSGKTVYLDANNNGLLDTGERSVESGLMGKFEFKDVAPGTYAVRRLLDAPYRTSTPVPVLTLASGQTVSGLLIGTTDLPLDGGESGKVSGNLFYDDDADGVWDEGESFQAGKLVYLDANNNAQLDTDEQTTTSGYLGFFEFAGVKPGAYAVRRVLESPYIATTPVPVVALGSAANITGLLIGTGEPRPVF